MAALPVFPKMIWRHIIIVNCTMSSCLPTSTAMDGVREGVRGWLLSPYSPTGAAGQWGRSPRLECKVFALTHPLPLRGFISMHHGGLQHVPCVKPCTIVKYLIGAAVKGHTEAMYMLAVAGFRIDVCKHCISCWSAWTTAKGLSRLCIHTPST